MHAMSEHAGVGVLPFDGMGLYEQPRPPRLVFKMPRVVPDQKTKFEGDELFRRLSRESEVSSCHGKLKGTGVDTGTLKRFGGKKFCLLQKLNL